MSKGGVVFQKTAKGAEEMTTRKYGLSPKVRRILIMVDGKRTVNLLREMIVADDLSHTLGMLEEDGYIEVSAIANGSGAMTQPPPGPLPSISAFRDEPPPDDMMRLQMSRNFMENTIKAFIGTVGMSGLIDRISGAKSLAELRTYFDEWYQVIVNSRDGRRQAEALREKLLETI